MSAQHDFRQGDNTHLHGTLRLRRQLKQDLAPDRPCHCREGGGSRPQEPWKSRVESQNPSPREAGEPGRRNTHLGLAFPEQEAHTDMQILRVLDKLKPDSAKDQSRQDRDVRAGQSIHSRCAVTGPDRLLLDNFLDLDCLTGRADVHHGLRGGRKGSQHSRSRSPAHRKQQGSPASAS